MARVVEIMLLLAPIAGFLAWRLLFPERDLPRGAIVAMSAALIVAAAMLIWVHEHDAEPPDHAYIPAHIENGRVVPAGEAPR
jgi:hypothetical protein